MCFKPNRLKEEIVKFYGTCIKLIINLIALLSGIIGYFLCKQLPLCDT